MKGRSGPRIPKIKDIVPRASIAQPKRGSYVKRMLGQLKRLNKPSRGQIKYR